MFIFLKNLLFTLAVPGTVAVYIPVLIANGRSLASGVLFVVAVLVLVLGAAIYGWCIWDFATFGRGTPAPVDEPKCLVVRGLYRHTRNPMYLGVLTVIVGWAILYGALLIFLYGVAIGVIFHLFVVFYEEPHLSRKYGDDYNSYRSQVARWLPRFDG